MVEDVYLIGQTCQDYYADSLQFEKKTQTFKHFLSENIEEVLKLKAKFPKGFHNTRILIRGQLMTWEEFVPDCFGVSRQYIDKLLNPTEKQLLRSKVVELEMKVRELSEDLQAKVAAEQGDTPAGKIGLPSFGAEDGVLSDVDEKPTFQQVVCYFESFDAEEQVRQLAVLCEQLGLKMSTE